MNLFLFYSIVCVHIGPELPSYLDTALAQARLFNPDSAIVLIANAEALEGFDRRSDITCVSCESLPQTLEHETFLKRTKSPVGYQRYVKERFLYLYDYMAASSATNVFHIENDVLLYVDLGKLLPVFQQYYPGIGATFESPFKCIPGFLFVAHPGAMQKLASYFAIKAPYEISDMGLIAQFWKRHEREIDCLPMMVERYFLDHSNSETKRRHCNHIAQFGSIFDGAAIGVFFDGVERAGFPPGYRMKALFDPALVNYGWELDEEGRRVPYAIYGGEKCRINNLHIASKRLELFSSTRQLQNSPSCMAEELAFWRSHFSLGKWDVIKVKAKIMGI